MTVAMPAALVLMSETITTAQSAVAKTAAIAKIGRVESLTLQFILTYGSGGTSVDAWVQTSFDNGATWIDIANFHFTTASATRLYNLTAAAVTSAATPADGALSANTVLNGFLGNQFRVKFTSVGTYAGSTTVVVTALPK